MTTSLFYPLPRYIKQIVSCGDRETVRSLCEKNHIRCRMTGVSADRVVFLEQAAQNFVEVVPLGGTVRICSVHPLRSQESYKYALALLAYGIHDYPAKESVRIHRDFSEIEPASTP